MLQTTAQYYGFKNRIINGAFVFDQRNNGAQYAPSGVGDVYCLDRWAIQRSQTGKYTVQQYAVGGLPGYTNAIQITSTSAYSVVSGDYFGIYQYIEGSNIADFAWGTSSAKSATVSFWAYSSLTGNFGGLIANNNYSRCYPFLYNIPTANTWTYITVTIPGDTAGTWLNGNNRGIQLTFPLGTGSSYLGTPGAWSSTQYLGATGQVSLVGTSGATLYITGVQFEVGTQATTFDVRSYGTELALCQRYYTRILYPASSGCDVANLQAYATTGVYGKVVDLPVQMRAIPTCGYSSLAHFAPSSANSTTQSVFTAISLTNSTPNQIGIGSAIGSSGLVAGNASVLVTASTSAWFDASAEL